MLLQCRHSKTLDVESRNKEPLFVEIEFRKGIHLHLFASEDGGGAPYSHLSVPSPLTSMTWLTHHTGSGVYQNSHYTIVGLLRSPLIGICKVPAIQFRWTQQHPCNRRACEQDLCPLWVPEYPHCLSGTHFYMCC